MSDPGEAEHPAPRGPEDAHVAVEDSDDPAGPEAIHDLEENREVHAEGTGEQATDDVQNLKLPMSERPQTTFRM